MSQTDIDVEKVVMQKNDNGVSNEEKISSQEFKTNAYGRFIANHAGKFMIGIVLIATILIYITFITFGVELDTSNSFVVRSGEIGNNYDTLVITESDEVVYDYLTQANGPITVETFEQQSQPSLVIQLVYELVGDGDDLLTEENLRSILDFEKGITELTDYEDWCHKPVRNGTYISTCSTLLTGSVLELLYNENTDSFIPASILANTLSQSVADAYFAKGFKDTAKSRFLKSNLSFGLPAVGYTTITDENLSKQNDLFATWTRSLLPYFQDQNSDETVESTNFRFFYAGSGITDNEFLSILIVDGLKAIGSVLVVYGYMAFHTKSFFLAAVGLFHILLSLPLGVFIYRVVLGAVYFGQLNILSIYIILGIGADDVFIMLDAWKQSALEPKRISGSVESRMSWSIARAGKAMLISSVTTAAAFYVNIASPIPPIAFFGIYTGSLVVFNYLLVISWFPSAIILKHRRSHQKVDEATATGQDKKEAEYRGLEIFFRDTYAPFVYKNRTLILLFFIVMVTVLGIIGSNIQPAEDPGQFLDDESNLQQFISLSNDEFVNTLFVASVSVSYGVTGIDRSNADPTDVEYLGDVEFDPDFDPTSIAAQQHLLETCELMKQLPSIRTHTEGTGNNETEVIEVGCVYNDLREFLGINDTNVFIEPQDFVGALQNYTNARTAQTAASGINIRGGDGISSKEGTWVGFDADTGELKYMKFVANITLSGAQSTTAVVARPFYEEWDEFMDERNEAAVAAGIIGLSKGIQSSDSWISMATEEVLLDLAVAGAFISLGVSFVIMFIATRNFIVTSYVILSVGLVFVSLLGVMVILGWTLGTIESISLTITVGLAVDYVVHLANSFNESKASTRFLRLQEGLLEMGISVFSSAVTTLLSATLLFFAVLIFFSRFGEFIFIVIFLSFIWAFGFFFALISIAGPTSDSLFPSILPLDWTGEELKFTTPKN